MSDCIDTFIAAGPLETTAVRLFRSVLCVARRGDRALAAVGSVPLRWQERARERRQLAMLNDRMLRDIGVSRADVERESNKPFWFP
jgi:uncharacterized protein YjiS (DUF1127 family)